MQIQWMRTILLPLLCLCLGFSIRGADRDVIVQQFVDYFVQSPISESSATKLLETLGPEGRWEDIDYSSTRRGNWPTREHLDRLVELATVYAEPQSALYRDNDLLSGVFRGLEHWIENDYQNPNWYNARIGVPYRLGTVLILVEDVIPLEKLNDARTILYRSELGMTGQNKVWCAGIGIMKGVLYDDQSLLEEAVKEVWSELVVTTDEGIQPDWSFHQHGPQQQFGNYGKSFGADMVQWASVLRGTQYALSGESLQVLRNYLLEGPSWILWNGRMDLSGNGRQLNEGSQRKKGMEIRSQLANMQVIDPDFQQAYRRRMDSIPERRLDHSVEINRFTGFKSFWRSEMGVHRRPRWYASVKMSSTRVIGSETNNSENMQGLHLGDGVLLTYLDGDEYEDLVPLWDWKRLPGTTCDQGLVDLLPVANGSYGGSSYAGVIGGVDTGIAAMIYKREGLSARKSWFFLNDQIVCLGAGISGETKGEVFTSVEQSWSKGKIERKDDWVWHNDTGYHFLEGSPFVAKEKVEGNWNSSFPTRGDRPAIGHVFSIWINHGESPVFQSYAYRVFPQVKLEEIQAAKMKDTSNVLSNTSKLQAIEIDETVCAVFFESGLLNVRGREMEVDGPCLLIVSDMKALVSDPTHSLESLKLKVRGKRYEIDLPQGAFAGKQVSVDLED